VDTVRSQPKSWKIAGIAVFGICVAALAGWVFIALGGYDVAADAPHTAPVHWLINEIRNHSIAARSKNIQLPPDLAQPARVSAGADLYNEMCSNCHLAPGMEKTEISQGLYPAAPELSHGTGLTSQEKFWIIKHGVKMTGMAAWGKTHNDTLIWNMVAFLDKLPSLTSQQYQALVRSAPEDHDEMMKNMNDMPDMHHDDHH
jgi:mono/diheme cytochrome c family protein